MENKLKEARQAAGLTQSEMASSLEIPKRTIENWETFKNSPPPYVERLIIAELNRIAQKGGA